MVGHSKLASDIEARHCATTGQASGQVMPEMLPPLHTQLLTLQQALQDCQEFRIKDQQELQTKDQQLQDSQRQIEELTQQVQEKQDIIDEREKQLKATKEDLLQREKITRESQEVIYQKAPEKMRRGSAASDSNMAYFNGHGSTTVYSYDSDTQEWNRLPATPYTHFTLVVVQHILTIVGGMVEYMIGGQMVHTGEATNSLPSLIGEGRDKKWLPHFPAMPTKRYLTAVVYSGRFLIVAGGAQHKILTDAKVLTTVEVLDTDIRQWFIASSLPHPFYLATISICGERLYMLGGINQTDETRSVLSCSIAELIQSRQPQSLTAPANQPTIVWRRVADVPHYYSSCATLRGRLIAVGGYHDMHIEAIVAYNERTDSWENMIRMTTARYRALVAVLNGKIMVVGGENNPSSRNEMDVVEIL